MLLGLLHNSLWLNHLKYFPYFSPVREADWTEGWDPTLVISKSGVAEVNCIFLTKANPSSTIWCITRHEPDSGFVEMIKITPTVTACRLTIQLFQVDAGSEETISYTHTSLGQEDDTFVASFTEEHYLQFMRDWEARLNHYLTHESVLQTGTER